MHHFLCIIGNDRCMCWTWMACNHTTYTADYANGDPGSLGSRFSTPHSATFRSMSHVSLQETEQKPADSAWPAIFFMWTVFIIGQHFERRAGWRWNRTGLLQLQYTVNSAFQICLGTNESKLQIEENLKWRMFRSDILTWITKIEHWKRKSLNL